VDLIIYKVLPIRRHPYRIDYKQKTVEIINIHNYQQGASRNEEKTIKPKKHFISSECGVWDNFHELRLIP